MTQLMSGWSHPSVLVRDGCYSLAWRRFCSASSSDVDANASDAAVSYDERMRSPPPASRSASTTSLCSSSPTGSSGPADAALSHVGDSGRAKMVDVGSKSATSRAATAAGRVKLGELAFRLVVENRLKKGDVLSTAQLAGVMAAKQTSRLIPLCHNVALTSVDVTLTLDGASRSVVVECTARCRGRTGVEMEALTGVAVAALTVYDMCKSVSHDIVICDIQLVSKTGGKSDFSRR